MENCDCIEALWAADDPQMKYQFFADFLTKYTSSHGIEKYARARWVLILFGAFIILCGSTHFITLWTFDTHSTTVSLILTGSKLLTAVVSCFTVLILVHVIPEIVTDLVTHRLREHFLRTKAAELDREMGLILNEEESRQCVRMLTQEIRSTLDKHTILETTLVELGKALGLQDCTVWMPSKHGLDLHFEHSLRQINLPLPTVSRYHPTLKEVFRSDRPLIISSSSPVASVRSSSGKYFTGEIAAIRVPLIYHYNFETGDSAELQCQSQPQRQYALMVLTLPPPRSWHTYQLELVQNVSEQVAMALSHAAILEQTIKDTDCLAEQNEALIRARHEAETAFHASNNFIVLMNHEIRPPIDCIISSSFLLQASDLSAEQRSMVEIILKDSKLILTFVEDVLDISKLEEGSAQPDNRQFNVLSAFEDVLNLFKPVVLMRNLSLSLVWGSSIPECAVGDQKRLMQTIFFIVANAIKFTEEGGVTVIVSVGRPDKNKEFDLKVQVKDTGIGMSLDDMPDVFNKFVHAKTQGGSTGLSLAICKRFVSLMKGHIWLESEGPGKGSTVTFTVKLSWVIEETKTNTNAQIPTPSLRSAYIRT